MQGGIDWETGLVPDDSPNRLLKEKLIEVISEAGLQQMQMEPTRGQNLLDLSCCKKPSLVKACISIPGISDHSIVLADCDLKATINKKPPRKVYQWSKADWQLIKEQTVIFAKQFLALAQTRTVKENYTVFIEYMEGILAVNIPSKLLKRNFLYLCSEILNSQFKSVFTTQSGNTFPQLPGTQFPKIKPLHISENCVFMLLDRIDVSKSSGPDKLPGRLQQSLAK